MAQSQFSLLWNAHKRNICDGLSSLQQNGEFVDMTIAADGHMVKVHQVIIALASPFIKELLSTAQCPHPVIFLNKISYRTLSSLLEYVYTGEVLVAVENLNEFIEAGKELHIKGLEDMKIAESLGATQQVSHNESDCNVECLDEEISYFEITSAKDNDDEEKYISNVIVQSEDGHRVLNAPAEETDDEYQDDDNSVSQDASRADSKQSNGDPYISGLQFTVSNQGSLQMILNRYVYYLKHTNKNNTRQWRCVDYLTSIKCPAHVFTKDNVVVQRISAHVHPFHDKRILRKVKAGAVFSAIHEAEKRRKLKQEEVKNSD